MENAVIKGRIIELDENRKDELMKGLESL